MGLVGVLRMTDRDLTTLAVGTDFASLNLNLSSAEPLHAAFAVPWAEAPVAREPTFSLPASYKVPQPALKTGHFSKFEVGTLLYIFYAMPRDVLQAYAAQELYTREWRYHKDHKLWFKREVPAGAPPATPPAFVYWDIATWDKKTFAGSAVALASGFLSDEEARVKPPPAPAAGAPAPAPPA